MESIVYEHESLPIATSQLSDDQLEGIHFLLLKSPPCELHMILNEIKDLLPDKQIPHAFLESTLKEYNLSHNTLVPTPGEQRPIVLHGLMDDENVYRSVLSGKSYSYDHITNQIIQEVDVGEPYCDDKMRPLRDDVICSGKQYVERRFLKNCGFYVGVDGNHMDLIITGELNKVDSFYSGRWVGRYSLDYLDLKLRVKGSVDIATHYFENGNIRMDLHKEMDVVDIALSSKECGSQLFSMIGEFEDKVQEGLSTAFASLQQDTLKSFRRQLPRTHQHFQWQVNAHKMADTMRQAQRQ